MKKFILSVGMASVTASMLFTGCASSTNEIVTHFNTPPARYRVPIAGKEAEAKKVEAELEKLTVKDFDLQLKLLAQRSTLLIGRCKKLQPEKYGAVATASAVTIDASGVVMEDGTYRSSKVGKTYCEIYDKSEAMKLASQKLAKEGGDASVAVSGMSEDQLRQIVSTGASISASLDYKQTCMTLESILSETNKSIQTLTGLIPTLTKRIADIAAEVTKLGASVAQNPKVQKLTMEIAAELKANPAAAFKPTEKLKGLRSELDVVKKQLQAEVDRQTALLNAEKNCLTLEVNEAKILIDYGAYIGKSCTYMLQALKETNAIVNAANEAIAKAKNSSQNAD